jgi:hypothetical protein
MKNCAHKNKKLSSTIITELDIETIDIVPRALTFICADCGKRDLQLNEIEREIAEYMYNSSKYWAKRKLEDSIRKIFE